MRGLQVIVAFRKSQACTKTKRDEAQLDIKARGFWRRNRAALFDVNVTHVKKSRE